MQEKILNLLTCWTQCVQIAGLAQELVQRIGSLKRELEASLKKFWGVVPGGFSDKTLTALRQSFGPRSRILFFRPFRSAQFNQNGAVIRARLIRQDLRTLQSRQEPLCDADVIDPPPTVPQASIFPVGPPGVLPGLFRMKMSKGVYKSQI